MSMQADQEDILNNEPATAPTTPSTPLNSVDEEILNQVRFAAECAEEKKAGNILVLRLSAITEFTDYFVICSGTSTRQTQAIADEITEQFKKINLRPLNSEGYQTGEWILLDYGSFIVHIFTESSRQFYDLERLWRDAERVV